MQIKVAITTIGCRSNQADSVVLARELQAYHVDIVEEFAEASVVLVNTCCVTTEAERDCRKVTRRALQSSENLRVIVFGCAVNAFPDFFLGMGERVEIASWEDGRVPALVSKITAIAKLKEKSGELFGDLPGSLGRTRALLKIQNGCSHYCSYCIVPKARGKEESLEEAEVLDRVDVLLDQGYREIVVTGVQLGAWGKDLQKEPGLAGLVTKIADRISPSRLRLSSIEPWAVDDELIEAIAGHSRICSHLHLPLQSGDDVILKAMNRGCTVSNFLEMIDMVRNRIPEAAIGTDIIFGFPGEDEKAFENTLATLDKMDPAYLHAFTYSPRSGTKAAGMPGRPPKSVAKERTRAARQAGEGFAKKFRTSQIGQVREVIVEEKTGNHFHGLTDTFIPVSLDSSTVNPGDLVECQLEPSSDNAQRLKAIPV